MTNIIFPSARNPTASVAQDIMGVLQHAIRKY